jgi:hypothetical protein
VRQHARSWRTSTKDRRKIRAQDSGRSHRVTRARNARQRLFFYSRAGSRNTQETTNPGHNRFQAGPDSREQGRFTAAVTGAGPIGCGASSWQRTGRARSWRRISRFPAGPAPGERTDRSAMARFRTAAIRAAGAIWAGGGGRSRANPGSRRSRADPGSRSDPGGRDRGRLGDPPDRRQQAAAGRRETGRFGRFPGGRAAAAAGDGDGQRDQRKRKFWIKHELRRAVDALDLGSDTMLGISNLYSRGAKDHNI